MKKVLTYLTPILVAITTIIGIINNSKSNNLAIAMQELEVKNKDIFDSLLMLKQSQELAKFDREFKFKIYEDVKIAVKDGDETLQKFTADFITVMVQDVVFRDALLKSLIGSKKATDSFKKSIQTNFINESKFLLEQKTLDNDLTKLSKEISLAMKKDIYDSSINLTLAPIPLPRVDVFYLEETMESHQSKKKAEAYAAQLDSAKFKIRVRILPKLVNAKSGYMIVQNQIRYEKSELFIATEINKELNKGFALNLTNNHTPNYISVFVYD